MSNTQREYAKISKTYDIRIRILKIETQYI